LAVRSAAETVNHRFSAAGRYAVDRSAADIFKARPRAARKRGSIEGPVYVDQGAAG
jgi:hypothetical protein